ncbi:MAG: DUF4124 domain-containing protein [Burkholderiales bacterium]
MRFSLVLALLLAAPVYAGTYKWVDENGVTHYGDRVPPEYTNRGNQELNRRGVVIRKTEPAMTPGQRKAIADEREARKFEEKIAAEQRRQDDALLMTYTSVGEIELKKERDLQQIEQAIANLQGQVQSAQERLNEQQKRVEPFTRTGKPAPEELASDIAETREQVARLNSRIARKVEESAEIGAKYEAYKKRFAELKGETPPEAASR